MERSDVQTKLVRAVLDNVETSLGGRISYSRILIKPLNTFVINDLTIIDATPWPDEFGKGFSPIDTILSVRSLSGTFSIWGLFNSEGVYLSRVNMKDGMFCMVSEPNQWHSNLNRFLRNKGAPEVPVEGPALFNIRHLSVDGFRFRLHNLMDVPYRHRGVGFNWGDLDLKARRIDGRNVRFAGGRLSFSVELTDVADKCGYRASLISGNAKCGIGKVLMDNVLVKDELSLINVPKFTMSFKNSYSFADYVNAVRMDGTLGATSLDGRTLRYFIDALPDNTARINIEPGAVVYGFVNDLFVDNFRFNDRNGVHGNLSCHLTGLTNIRSMIMKADVHQLTFTAKGASALLKSIIPSSKANFSNLGKGVSFHFSGTASGPVNKLTARGRLSSGDGFLSTNLDIRNLADRTHVPEIRGSASLSNFELGNLFGTKALGECSMNTDFRAIMVPKEPSVIIDSLIVGKLGALGYNYSGIKAAGKLTGKSFDGKVICDDPNLNFLFQGIFDFSKTTQNALYRFYANLGYADLDALNLDKRGLGSKASCQIVANYRRIVRGDGVGAIKINDILIEDINGMHDMGSITVKSNDGTGGYKISLNSKFVDGSFTGTGAIPDFIEDLQKLTIRRHIPALYPSKALPHSTGTYDLDFHFHDSRDLLSYIKPGLYIADSTEFKMNISKDGLVQGIVSSPRLAYKTSYIKGSSIEFDNSGGSVGTILTNKEISIGGIKAHQSTIIVNAADNEVAAGIHFNEEEDASDYAELFINADFRRDETDTLIITARPLQSSFNLAGKLWDIDSSKVCIRGGRIEVDGFRISHDGQEILLDGSYSQHEGDSLKLDIHKLGLSILGDLSGNTLDIPGEIEGQALLVSGKDKLLSLDMVCDSAVVKGAITPSTGLIDLDAKLDKTRLAIAEPFLKGIASNLSGTIDGEIGVHGKIGSAEITSSDVKLQDASMTIDFTGANYVLNGPMSIGNDGIRFLDVSISDGNGGRGTLSGGLVYDRLREMNLDTHVKLRNLLTLDNMQEVGKGIYGKVAADADISVTGPFDNIRIDGNVSTTGRGQIHVPLNSAVAATGSDLLIFKEKELTQYIDPYEEMMQQISSFAETTVKRKGNIGIHVLANATPGVTAHMELNKSTGNVITASGSGSVLIDIQTLTNNMNLSGEYRINDGKLHFELPGIVKKEFDLQNGSSLHFNGPVKNSDLDITAIYNLKTSLSTLLSDTTSVSTRRPVKCSIKISDKITSPQISFGVEVPDLDPASRTKMTEALNTEDKVQKQFMALLVMGTFLPNESSGVVNSANILYSNVGEIMSNQLNKIFRRLNIPVDLGLGYQQGKSGNDIFDVAISTQLFNNRVEIGGTVGNRQYRNSKNPYGDVVGDIDISIKLDKSGQFKLNLFSHSADEFTSFLDYSQRNGLGIAYQKEYDNFFKMLKEAFTPKKKRETQTETQEDKPSRTITIE